MVKPWLNQGNTHGYYHGFLNHQVGYNRSQQDFQNFLKFFFKKSYYGITMVKPSWLKPVKLPSQQSLFFSVKPTWLKPDKITKSTMFFCSYQNTVLV